MKISYDHAKNDWNIRERGLSFAEVDKFNFTTAVRVEDLRNDYGETRIVAYGFIGNRLYALCYKPLGEIDIRVISFRKANKREEKFYAQNIKTLNR